MGCYNSKIVSIWISLFVLLSLMIFYALPTLSLDELQPNAPVPQTDNYQAFQIKKRAPVFLNNRQDKNEKGNLYRNKSKRKGITKNLDARRFSAMLPKGYVPPSGSSPCHNVYPNSVTFFCDLSTEP